MSTFAQLSVDLGRFSRQIPRAQSVFTGTLAHAVAREEGLATPVDKGTARSNWQAGVGVDPSTRVSAHAPGRHLGRGESANQQVMLAEVDLALRSLQPGQDVYIVNNVSYMYDLNERGSSPQSPAGFVEIALQMGLVIGEREAFDALARILGGNP